MSDENCPNPLLPRSWQKPRFLPAGGEVMSDEIAPNPLLLRSRQKPRFLPAGGEVMSDEIARGNFVQSNYNPRAQNLEDP
jgi:hypothetical protein